jgi:hypothetical protein
VSYHNYLVREDPQVFCLFAPLPRTAAERPNDIKKEKEKKSLPPDDFVPLLCTGRRSEAVAAAVLLDVLGDVLPWQLAAARADVGALATVLVGTGDAAAEETDLCRIVSQRRTQGCGQNGWMHTSRSVHTGFLTRSHLSFVRTRTRPRKVDSASEKLPMTLISLYVYPSSRRLRRY